MTILKHSPSLSLIRLPPLPTVILFLASILYVVFAAALSSTFQVGAFADDARYIVVAESIATGHGLSLINYPSPVPETLFPPGYPLLLSVFVRLWPHSFVPLQLLSCASTAATMVVLWYMAKDMLSSRMSASVVVLLYAVHPWVVGSAGMVMSEAIFTFLSLVALTLAWKATEQGAKQYFTLIACAMLVVIAISVRSIGFALFFTIMCFLFLQQRWKAVVLFTLASVIAYLPLWVRNAALGGGLISSGYSSFLVTGLSKDELGASVRNMFEYIAYAIPAFVLPIPGFHEEIPTVATAVDVLSGLVGISLTLISVSVIARNVTRLWQLVTLYVAFYLLVLILYRHHAPELAASTRYLLPLLPVFLIILARACEEFVRRMPLQGFVQMGMSLLVVAVLVLYVGRNVQAWLNPIRNRIPDLSIGATWIAAHTGNDAVVATPDPVSTYLYTKRKTVPLLGETSEEFLASLLESEADYVLIKPELRIDAGASLDHRASAVWLPTIQRCPEAFQIVFENTESNVSVYRLSRLEITTHCATVLSSSSMSEDIAH